MKYACAYGHVVRFERAKTAAEAAKLAFGMTDTRRMTVREFRKLTKTAEREFMRELALRHFRKTGSVLEGWQNEPGIANTHWTECLLCRKPILTEPKSAGCDNCICQECEPKYYSLHEVDREELSISKMRERLNIVPR